MHFLTVYNFQMVKLLVFKTEMVNIIANKDFIIICIGLIITPSFVCHNF